jgi:hypothetical protein
MILQIWEGYDGRNFANRSVFLFLQVPDDRVWRLPELVSYGEEFRA